MKKITLLFFVLGLGFSLAFTGCHAKKKDKTGGRKTEVNAGAKRVRAGDHKNTASRKGRFGALAADLCRAEKYPGLVVQAFEFTTRLRNTDLMLDLQDMSLEQALEQARVEADQVAGELKKDLDAHPMETCATSEEDVPCVDAAEDLSAAGGALFESTAVQSIFKAMGVTACGYLVADYKLQGREFQSQKFLAGKRNGQWQMLTEMPEMR